MNQIKAIIFDFDGVIVDSEPLYEQVETELFRYFGTEINIDDIRDTKGLSEEMYLRIIRDRYNLDIPINKLKSKGRTLLKQTFAKQLNYMPGFMDFFNLIHKRFITGLATSSSRNLMDWIFQHTPVRNHFSHTVTADDVTHSKPHPEPYQKICSLLSVKPQQALVIEDSINGLKSAAAAGAITIAFQGRSTASEFPKADYTVSNYREIEPILDALTTQLKPK